MVCRHGMSKHPVDGGPVVFQDRARHLFVPIFPPDDQGPRKLNKEVAQPLRVLAEGHHRIVVDTGRLEMEGRKLSLRRQQCE